VDILDGILHFTDYEFDLNALEKHDLIKTHNSQSYIALN